MMANDKLARSAFLCCCCGGGLKLVVLVRVGAARALPSPRAAFPRSQRRRISSATGSGPIIIQLDGFGARAQRAAREQLNETHERAPGSKVI